MQHKKRLFSRFFPVLKDSKPSLIKVSLYVKICIGTNYVGGLFWRLYSLSYVLY